MVKPESVQAPSFATLVQAFFAEHLQRGGIRSIAVFPIIGSISQRVRRLVMIWPIWGNIMPIMCD